MAGGAAFADILQDMVGGRADTAGRPDPIFQAPRFTPPDPLLFATPIRPFRTSPYRGVRFDDGGAFRRTVPPPQPPRRPRPLTTRQRQALDAFVALGADLTAASTAAELRSAFRQLALRYHPDRHPGSSQGEQARLTRVLADLNEHHQHLAAAFRPAA